MILRLILKIRLGEIIIQQIKIEEVILTLPPEGQVLILLHRIIDQAEVTQTAVAKEVIQDLLLLQDLQVITHQEAHIEEIKKTLS